MFKRLVIMACSAAMFCAPAQAQLKVPSASTSQSIKQEFGLGNIELSYSRPNMKGRAIFGDLVPYGKVWRTGANQATTITFSDDVTIGGKAVAAGKYGLLSIPNAKSWTLIITKQLDVNSPALYKPENDVVRVEAETMQMQWPMETFTMQFVDVKPTSCALFIAWDKTFVALPITTSIDEKVMSQINTLMSGDKKPYFGAAVYYLDNGKDVNKAVEWLDKAVEENPTAFWVYYQRARALAKAGKKQEAITSAKKSIELAKAAKNDDYVALNEKLLRDLK